MPLPRCAPELEGRWPDSMIHTASGAAYIRTLDGQVFRADFCLLCGRPDDSKEPPCTCLADWLEEWWS